MVRWEDLVRVREMEIMFTLGRKVGEQRRRDNNYLSLMLHRSMCKSLKFPREPC